MPNDPRPSAARLGRALAVLALAASLGSARAGTDFTLNAATPNPGLLPGGGWQFTPGKVPNQIPAFDPPPPRTFTPLPGGGVIVDQPFQLPGKGGNLPVKFRQTVKIADAAAAIGRCVRNPVCAAAAVGVGAYLLSKYLTRRSSDGELERDPGQPQSDFSGYTCSMTGFSAKASSADAACKAVASDYAATQVKQSSTADCLSVFSYTSSSLGGNQFGLMRTVTITTLRPGLPGNWCGTSGTTQISLMTATPSVFKQCPPVVDFYDPAYSVPGGPVGYDGKCPTGVYSERMTPEQLGTRVAAYPPPSGQDFPDALRKVVEQGQESPSTASSEGPATQVGAPVKTTTTDASGTKTTTSTPTYNYHYAGDTITYDTTVTTTVVNNDGSTSTSTTTTEGTKPEDKDDPCVKNPNRLGCMELGAAPDDRIPKSSRDVSFASEDLGLASSCPAPVDLPHGQKISYQTLCDGLTQTRPLIIAIGFLMAGGIVVAALRR